MAKRTLIPWAPATIAPLNLAIAKRAALDIGICEMPPSSNRSPRIDEYNLKAGVAVGSYWCASAVGAWWDEAADFVGVTLELPKGYASCDNWMTWAVKTMRWFSKPVIGAAVVYGKPGDATHIGIITRTDTHLLSVEGNTTLEGFSRNGEIVAQKSVRTANVLGYVYPIL